MSPDSLFSIKNKKSADIFTRRKVCRIKHVVKTLIFKIICDISI